MRSLMGPAEWQRYEQDPERGTLMRLLRAAELAGHDVDDVLSRAIEGRDFGGARSVAAVLHGRVQRMVGTPGPVASTGYVGRTPALEDPEADRFARDLTAAMDERVSVLGNRVAMDGPVWALRYLGEVPADPVERADWLRRAGIAAAYREERGYAHETEPIGPAPERGSPEQRASWHAAYTALRMPEGEREVATASDGELWARRDASAREAAWAPPYVAGESRDAHIAEDTYRADAVRAWYRVDAAVDDAGRMRARQEAEEYSALAQEVGAYREALTDVADVRYRRWGPRSCDRFATSAPYGSATCYGSPILPRRLRHVRLARGLGRSGRLPSRRCLTRIGHDRASPTFPTAVRRAGLTRLCAQTAEAPGSSRRGRHRHDQRQGLLDIQVCRASGPSCW